MGDLVNFGITGAATFLQMLQAWLQGRMQGKQFEAARTEILAKMEELRQEVLARLPANSTPEQVAKATTDALLNTPIQAIFISEQVNINMPPKKMPPTTGTGGILV